MASQIRWAISSVSLSGRDLVTPGGLCFELALGSLCEANARMRVVPAWGFVAADAAEAVLQSMELLGGRVFGGAVAMMSR